MGVSLLNPTLGVAYGNITPIKGATGGWTATSGDAPPPTYTGGTETEHIQVPGPQTVNASNGSSAAAVTGGFQLVAGVAGTMTRQDH